MSTQGPGVSWGSYFPSRTTAPTLPVPPAPPPPRASPLSSASRTSCKSLKELDCRGAARPSRFSCSILKTSESSRRRWLPRSESILWGWEAARSEVRSGGQDEHGGREWVSGGGGEWGEGFWGPEENCLDLERWAPLHPSLGSQSLLVLQDPTLPPRLAGT